MEAWREQKGSGVGVGLVVVLVFGFVVKVRDWVWVGGLKVVLTGGGRVGEVACSWG